MKNVFLLFVFIFGLAIFAEGQELSLNKPISALTKYGDGFEAENANDGDIATRWASADGADVDKSIAIDLEEIKDIGAVRIIWEAAYSTDFTIEVSDDSTNWTVVQTISGHASLGTQDFENLNTSGRYVRLYSTAGVSGWISIFEFTIYGAEGIPAEVIPAEIISIDKAVTTSSNWDASYAGSFAVDGDVNTRWASGGDGPHLFTLDLEGYYLIDSIQILWEAAFGKDFIIRVSDDAETWTDVVTVVGAESGGQQSYRDIAAKGQYVSLEVTDGAHAHASIFEFTVFGAETTIDPVSLNKTVSSSSIWGAGYEADKAVDGDMETRWASNGDAAPHWVSIDLADVYDIDSVQISWEVSYGKDYTIDVSDDGSTWTTIQTVADNTSEGLLCYKGFEAKGQYVRLHVSASGPNNFVSVYEFSVFGKLAVVEPEPDPIEESVSLNKSANASSIWGADFAAGNVTDANRDSRWASSGDAAPHWITIDLEDVYDIDSIYVIWESSYGKDYTIDVSDDDLTWTTIKMVVNNDSDSLLVYEDLDAKGQYVRLYVSASGPNSFVSLYEFAVFGELSSVGLNPSEEQVKIHVYPNPVSDMFKVIASGDSEAKLSIFELSGRLVYSDRFVKTKTLSSKEIGLSGLYIIQVETDTNIYSEKVIVK